jgi:hypothetical protein
MLPPYNKDKREPKRNKYLIHATPMPIHLEKISLAILYVFLRTKCTKKGKI